jgi:Domain of unknown function (DUF4397)
MRFFRAAGACLLLSTMALLTNGCNSNGNNAQLRALQASADEATTLNVLLDGNTVFSNLVLGTPSSYMSESLGSRHLQVEPSNSSTPSIDETLTLDSSTNYTLITANVASSLTPILLTDDQTAPASGDFQLRFVNAAPSAGPVDCYLVPSGTAVGGVGPTVASIGFTAASPYQSMTAGTYDLVFTQAGFPGVPYAQVSSIAFSSGQNRTVVLTPDALGGYAAVMLNDLN